MSDPPGINYMHRRRVAHDSEALALGTLETALRVVVITVADNGPGLPESREDNVFDPFFTTKEPGKGTGLGLFICARLVSGMGGRIEVENRPGQGARFVVRLPEALSASVTLRESEQTKQVDMQEVE
jgi:signal transduction histidine kinase